MDLEQKTSGVLDFERGLVTTKADIKAQRANRPFSSVGDLSNLNRLRSPFPAASDELRRKVVPGQPPFEL